MKHEGAFEGSSNANSGEWNMTPPAGDVEAFGDVGDRGDDEVLEDAGELGDDAGFENWSESGDDGIFESGDVQGMEADPGEIEQERKNLFERITKNAKVRRVFALMLAVTTAVIVAAAARGGRNVVDRPTNSPSYDIETISPTQPQERNFGDSVDEATPPSPSESETTSPDSPRELHYSNEIRYYRPDAGGEGGNFGEEVGSEEVAQVERVKDAIRSDSELARTLEDTYGITADSLDGAITAINLDEEPTIELATPEE